MKYALLLSLLLAACASPTAVMDKRTFPCGPGRDIEVRAGIDDVTVKSIRIQPIRQNVDEIDAASKTFDQLIPEGEDHVFEIPTGELSRSTHFDRKILGGSSRVEFSVRVELANGDSYHCAFEAVWR
jgi:hypothetical protein